MQWLESEFIGAIAGALVAAALSLWVIRRERRQAACAAIEALADEARFNAELVRHVRSDPSAISLSTLERLALDAALPMLLILPPNLRQRAHEARSTILWLMRIEEVLEAAAERSGTIPAAMAQRRERLIDEFPAALDSLHDDLEAFVSARCRFRPWR